jgi:hypothetical protein
MMAAEALLDLEANDSHTVAAFRTVPLNMANSTDLRHMAAETPGHSGMTTPVAVATLHMVLADPDFGLRHTVAFAPGQLA